ncbi:MAG: hypothetical protein LUD72_01960 [Bacteroidales bacterium]|nr:hypothetical protein [Bacteroidales bacterium]
MKLKSRKWWIVVAVCAYFAIMTLKDQGVESLAERIIYAVACAAVVISYLLIEGKLDSDRIIEETIEEDNEEE